MNKTLSQDESQSFDCSAFLGHGLQWPVNDCPKEVDRGIASRDVSECYDHYTKQELRVNDWGALLRDAVPQGKKHLEEQYYESEYNTLLEWMDVGDVIVPPPSLFADKREEIQRISLLADEALAKALYPSVPCRERPAPSCEYLANEVAIKAIETPREVMSPGSFQNFVHEQLVGFGDVPEKQQDQLQEGVIRKRRLCRHFVKGFCMRGDSCDFLHDQSIFCSDEQKVFLGGLPLHFTSAILKTKLEEQGLTVLNNPRIKRGFTPQVCLGTVKEAEELIARRVIFLGDQRVDIRPYKDKDELRQVLPSVVKRSVFLGGLPENTTGEMIVADLQRLDIEVVDFPVVKKGYAPRVVLGSVEHVKMLVTLKRIMVNGTAVDVRPYVNFRKRY